MLLKTQFYKKICAAKDKILKRRYKCCKNHNFKAQICATKDAISI